jgi:EAL domain-containing protein (putative c-di-GMP-specific phosphodiesterase class I)
VAPHRLKLELTESLVHDIDDTRAKMAALCRLGVGFSIDDFGTGYSSLSRLTTLPLSQLKVDQSFVQRMVNSPPDAVVVQTIIAMGHSLGLEVMAEGVETEQQLAMLIACGCTSFQGYLRSRPVPPDDFLRLLA